MFREHLSTAVTLCNLILEFRPKENTTTKTSKLKLLVKVVNTSRDVFKTVEHLRWSFL